MKHFVFISIIILLVFPVAKGYAEKKYVSDLAEITLRTGPGDDHKIITMIKSGQELEVVKEGKEWSKVRLPSGREGWALTRFITSEEPCSLLIKGLKNSKEIFKLTKENKQLRSELDFNEKALHDLRTSYETLKKESAELLKLKSDYKKSLAKMSEQQKKIERLEDELSSSEIHQNLRWFFSGAGVLFAGFLIGFSAKRQKRRSSLL